MDRDDRSPGRAVFDVPGLESFDQETRPVRILLVDDDEDEYVLVQKMIQDLPKGRFSLDWVDDFDEALKRMERAEHDVYLLDYRLGAQNGIELLKEALRRGCDAPIILLSGRGSHAVDVEAMRAGARDYLEKGRIDAQELERSIRYALERHRADLELLRSEEQLKILSRKLLEAHEQERSRIARELHDSIGGKLTAIKYALERRVDGGPDAGKNGSLSLDGVLSIVQQTITEVRNISTNLRPSVLDDLGIPATISWFCRQFSEIYTEMALERQIEIRDADIPEPLKIEIYRVLEEAMNNVAKHSAAKRVQVSLRYEERRLVLLIADDGRGFDPARAAGAAAEDTGMGIASMKDRIELTGGRFFLDSRPGVGTTVCAIWPVERVVAPGRYEETAGPE